MTVPCVPWQVFESPPINYRMRAEFRIWHVVSSPVHVSIFLSLT
jgi:tRNA/tmRNA/rRNA uracil-C5-methylase (TrmA/RlmC/RlmD family)